MGFKKRKEFCFFSVPLCENYLGELGLPLEILKK